MKNGSEYMSWERVSQSECKCPCGHGRIYQDHYSDDWNRHRSDRLRIECDKCKRDYFIETISYTKNDGENRSIYYCVKKDYPPYTGDRYQGKFTRGYNVNDLDCTQYFVENYSYDTLINVRSILSECGTYSKIEDKGIGSTAREIIRSYKGWYNTQRISTIINEVDKAIQKYYEYHCRFDTLKIGREQYKSYIEQMKKDSIQLAL